MVSLMNGLSAMGQGIADFAGRAGLEQQRADLAMKQMTLADQLATTRETAGRAQAGEIAATAATAEHGFQTGLHASDNAARLEQIGVSEAGANTRNAASVSAQYAQIAAGDETRAQDLLASRSRVAFEEVQTRNAQDLRTAHQALQTETGKPDADPTKIAALKSQVTSLETSASTEAAVTSAAAAMFRTDMDSVQHFNTQLVTATAALNNPEITDTDRTAQKGLISDLKTQLAGAQRALKYSSDLVHGRVAAQTGNAPPGVAPPPPAGVPPGARYSPSMKIWQAPDGQLFDASGRPTVAPGTQAAPPAAGFMNNGAGAP